MRRIPSCRTRSSPSSSWDPTVILSVSEHSICRRPYGSDREGRNDRQPPLDCCFQADGYVLDTRGAFSLSVTDVIDKSAEPGAWMTEPRTWVYSSTAVPLRFQHPPYGNRDRWSEFREVLAAGKGAPVGANVASVRTTRARRWMDSVKRIRYGCTEEIPPTPKLSTLLELSKGGPRSWPDDVQQATCF